MAMASKRTPVRMLVTGSVRMFAAVAHVQGKKTALTWGRRRTHSPPERT